MYRPLASSTRRTPARRGAVLIVVLGLLTLLAIFSLLFVFYADNEATSARIAREGEDFSEDDGAPNDFAIAGFNETLRGILFDEFDTPAGMLSPLRGHSLARSMYNGQVGTSPPFSGIGTFHETAPNGADRASWINFSAPYTSNSTPTPFKGTWTTFWLDPEWTNYRVNAELAAGTPPSLTGRNASFVPKNAPYTYPDLKDLILASLSPATGEVLVPSLHRNWLFNANNPNQHLRLAPWNPADVNPATNTAANTDWVTPEGRTRILRPRPIDQLTPADISAAGLPAITPGLGLYSGADLGNLYALINRSIAAGQIIPYPPFNADGSYTGDVQNLMGSVGVQRNDSILIDIGLPPRKWNGKWIKPLASILLTDLDGLLNLNAHGNMRGGAGDRGYHRSYNGFGPHEVNLGAVLGSPEAVNIIQARYGIPMWQPGASYTAGSYVVNAGNFYVCVNPQPPGNYGTSGPAPGPTSSYPTLASAHNDGGVQWVNLGLGLGSPPSTGVGALPWAPGTIYSPGNVVVNNNRYYICFASGGATSGPAPGPTGSYSAGSPYLDNPPNGPRWVDLPNGIDARVGLARNVQNNGNLKYMGGTQIPQYAAVNFDAGGSGGTVSAPNFPANAFQTNATFTNPLGNQSFFNDMSDSYAKALNHPLMYNTHDWPSGVAGRRVFGFGDLKRFNMRYAADRDYYLQTEVARTNIPGTNPGIPVANTSLVGTPAAYAVNGYRRDPAHTNRGPITTYSSHLDQAYQVGNFFANPPPPPLSFLTDTATGHPINQSFAGTVLPAGSGVGPDYIGPTDLRNPRAALGGIDLNRPLADYRSDTNTPLGQQSTTNAADTANSANTLQAWVDRHNLARDILGRLILATGANATVITTLTPTGVPAYPYYYPGDIIINANPANPPEVPQYNAIRYLAQLAANMVDLIDSDDVSTVFAWDVGALGVPAAAIPPRTIARATTANLGTTIPGGIVDTAAGQTPTGLVYGVEKPRLVINEAYGELTNADETLAAMATMPARVRFYVELMNPTAPASTSGTGPLGDGKVTLHNAATMTWQPYRMQITREAGTVATALASPTNVTGSLPAAADISFNFSTAAGTQRFILPNDNNWNYAAQPTGTRGFIMVGAPTWTNPHSDGTNDIEFNPNTAVAPYNQMILGTAAGAATSMEYNYPGALPPVATDLEADNMTNPLIGLRRHVVLLQRLANPYQTGPSATNPYITVDAMDWVPAFDAVAKGAGVMAQRTAKGAMNITNPGFEDTTNRYSVGKVQPYAGLASGATYVMGNNAFPLIQAFPQSMVVAQNPTTAPGGGTPKHTFFRMNARNDGSGGQPRPVAQTYTAAGMNINGGQPETIMAPFDWFVHYDRPLVNQMELLSLQGTKPHQVTQFTVRRDNTGSLVHNWGLAPWLGILEPPHPNAGYPGVNGNNGRTNNGLFRALESLRVKPWMHGVGFGGKQHGKINLNMVQDPRILDALFDPQTGNAFYDSVNPNFTQTSGSILNRLYTGQPGGPTPIPGLFTNTPGAPIAGSRTVDSQYRPVADPLTPISGAVGYVQVPIPGPTYDDVRDPFGPNFNRLPPYDRPFRGLGAAEYTADGSLTALANRVGSGLQDTILRVNTTGPTAGSPLISVPLNITQQPYLQTEMVRKIFNNTTTTSHAFGVTVTIVFHEVRMFGVDRMCVDEKTTPAMYYPVLAPGPVVTVAAPPAGLPVRYLIGKEVYKDIPGDLRQQFYAVLDRANLVVKPSTFWAPNTPYTFGSIVINGLGSYICTVPGISANAGGPTGNGTGIPDGATLRWDYTPLLQSQPFTTEFARLDPVPSPPPAGYQAHPPGTFNLYLTNSIPLASPIAYRRNGFASHSTTFYMDGRPITIGAGGNFPFPGPIVIGTGTNQEVVTWNYVNEDGSINVNRTNTQITHAAGEVVASFVPGNSGPVSAISALNPSPFDPMAPNNPFRAVVPYAQRVR